MAIAIGGNSVNKAYLGTSEVQKMYLGADLVFDNSIQPSGITPILTNFRVEDATPTQVHFDTPLGYPDGMTTTGFVISNKPINSVTKVDDNGGYFTVSSDFDFWDNTTIRLGEITDTSHSQSVLYDFSLEYIENNINEPDASTYRYVSLTGDNGNDGLTEGQAWRTLAYADGQLSAGMTLWVKAGDYGDDRMYFTTSGTPTSPIKIIGYKTAIGDGASLNWSYADTSPWSNSNPLAYVNGFDANELPLISGIDEKPSGGDRAIQVQAGNIIIKNIQVQFYDRGFFVVIEQQNVFLDNCYAACCTYPIMADNNLTKRFRCTNSVAFRGATNCIRSWGDEALVDNCQVWDDRYDVSEDVNEKYSTDYYIGIEGDNSIFRNNHAERVGNTTHDGHGFSMKGQYSSNEHCLVEKSTIMGINLAIEFSRVNTKYCVAKDVQISRQSATTKGDTGGITFLEKATWNLAERILVTDVNQGIFVTPPSDAKNNFVRNSIFDNCTMVIRGTGDSQTMEGCTIVNCGSMATEAATWTVIDTILSNTSRGSDSLFSYSYCDFHNSGTLPSGTGNILTDPQLDDNYLPGVQLDGTPVFGLEYDYDEVERNETTPTMGAMELDGVTPPVAEIDYYVSFADGLDTNDGLTEQTAWKTLSKVDAEASSFIPGDVIALKGGDLWNESLRLRDANGTVGNEITFTSYGTGKPTISGSEEITGFSNVGGDLWEADVTGKTIYHVQSNDIPKMCARFPIFAGDLNCDQNFLPITSVASQNLITVSGLAGLTDLVGATAHIQTELWLLESVLITSYNNATGEIGIESTSSSVGGGELMFVSNHVNLFNGLDEWVYNPTTETLTVSSASTPTNIFGVTGNFKGIDLYAITGNIIIQNIIIKDNYDTAIDIYGSPNIKITGCEFRNIWDFVISSYEGLNMQVIDNDFDYCWGRGVRSGLAASPHTVSNNRFNNFGVLSALSYIGWNRSESLAMGIDFGDVYENTIDMMGGFGIEITFVSNVYDNNVSSVALATRDNGAIYLNGVGVSGSKVYDNTLTANPNLPTGWQSMGMYSDESSTGVEYDNNTVTGFYYAHQIHKSQNITITNSRYLNSQEGSIQTGDKSDGLDVTGLVITGNDLSMDSATGFNLIIYNVDAGFDIGTLDYNTYSNPSNLNKVTTNTGGSTVEYTLSEWQIASGQDDNSTDGEVNLGPELVPDWNFPANPGAWTFSTPPWTIPIGQADYDASSASAIRNSFIITGGVNYQLEFEVLNSTAAGMYLAFYNLDASIIYYDYVYYLNGVHTLPLTPVSDESGMRVYGSSIGSSGSLGYVSVKEIL